MARRKQSNKQNDLNKNHLKLQSVSPLTDNQEIFFDSCTDESHHLLLGAAGTGKTYLALYKALQIMDAGQANKLIIFRSTVSSRDQGFLPGTAAEKAAPYEAPYRANVNKLFHRDDAYDLLVKQGVIQFASTAYERGNTLDDSVILIDECQNMTAGELDTLITRTGTNSRIFICGDLFQQDLVKHSEKNVHKVLEVLQLLRSFYTTHFTIADIVRSGIVKEYLTEKQTLYRAGY